MKMSELREALDRLDQIHGRAESIFDAKMPCNNSGHAKDIMRDSSEVKRILKAALAEAEVKL